MNEWLRLRRANSDDAVLLANFDIGPNQGPWHSEVTEIVGGLIRWRDHDAGSGNDRQVIVAYLATGEVVGVAAHEAASNERCTVFFDHRYLMVAAVGVEHQRHGIARTLITSVISQMQARGAASVTWLVHPHNTGSIGFSRNVFPDADETYPADDKPYASFLLRLR